MKLYAVTKGSYSNYTIITLTTDKEKAKKLAKIFSDGWGMASVEEYEDGEYDKYMNGDYHGFYFRISKDGKVITVNEVGLDYSTWQKDGEVTKTRATKLSDSEYQVTIYTNKGFEVAKKIAFDKIAQYKAKKKGL